MSTNTIRADAPPEPEPPPGAAGQDGPPRLVGAGSAARLLRPVRRKMIACGVLSSIAAAAGLAPYLAIAEIARAALGAPSAGAVGGTVWTWVAVGAAGALLRLALLGWSSHLGHQADADVLLDLRLRIVRRLGAVPLGWFRSSGSGEVKKAMTDDLEDLHHLIAHALGELAAGATALVVGVGYLALVDWRMALVTIAVPLAAVVAYRFAMRSMPEHMAALIAAEGRISAAGVEYADGITVVKTFGVGGRIMDRFADAVSEHSRAFKVWVTETRVSSALSNLLGAETTVLAAVLAVGLVLIGSGSLTTADLLPFLVVGIGLPTAFLPVVQGAQGLRKARLAAGRIEVLLARAPLPEPVEPLAPKGHGVELDRVTFSYDGVTNALEDVSVTCAPGTVTAVVGPSGAGKSTLAALLPRFYDVTGGAVRIGGVDVRDIAQDRLLATMSLVFQDVVLLRDTVTENIRIGRPDADDEEVRRAAKAAQVHHVVERLPLGYDTVLGGGTGGLSGGERQRLTIARAILSGAPVVVLDEATAALDPDGESAVQEALSELVAGKTVIVIAHRLHTVVAADRIVVLDGGRVAESGTHAELLARDGVFARMWRAQLNGGPAT